MKQQLLSSCHILAVRNANQGVWRNNGSLRSSALLSVRTLAFGTNWKLQRRKQGTPKRRKSPTTTVKSPTTTVSKADRTLAPPLFLLPTASPHAFVAKGAVANTNTDPQSLFRTVVERSDSELAFRRPALFSSPHYRFEYRGPLSTSSLSTSSSSVSPLIRDVAFLGRSNVGKSSLLNAVMNQDLARTSKAPGRTQHPQYFGYAAIEKTTTHSQHHHRRWLGGCVDLPGYGYAVGPDAAVDHWQRHTQRALLHRHNLARVYVLLDARHGGSTLDYSVLSWLEEAQLNFSVVLTKSDAVTAATLIKHANLLCMRYHHLQSDQQQLRQVRLRKEEKRNRKRENSSRQLGADNRIGMETEDRDEEDSFEDTIYMSPIIHVTSAKNKTGIAELLSSIEMDWKTAAEE